MTIVTVKYIADISEPAIYTGYLVNGNQNVPMVESNRQYIEVQQWINQGHTPQPPFSQEELDDYASQGLEAAMVSDINAIVVTHNGNDYSGGFDAQNGMVTAMAKLEGKGDIKTQNWFTVDNVKVALTRDDFDVLLDLIEPLHEAITDI